MDANEINGLRGAESAEIRCKKVSFPPYATVQWASDESLLRAVKTMPRSYSVPSLRDPFRSAVRPLQPFKFLPMKGSDAQIAVLRRRLGEQIK
jgi:hypothetical protein